MSTYAALPLKETSEWHTLESHLLRRTATYADTEAVLMCLADALAFRPEVVFTWHLAVDYMTWFKSS